VGYITLTGQGVVMEVNHTALALFALTRDRIQGRHFISFVHRQDRKRLSECLASARDTGAHATLEMRLKVRWPPVSEVVVQAVIKGRQGSATQPSFLVALMDVSERRRLEREHREALEARSAAAREEAVLRARNEAKDRFIARLSHELRTPLTPIVAALSDERIVSAAPDAVRRTLDMVRRNISLEVNLIDDLLDATRVIRDRLNIVKQPVDAHDAIREVVSMMRPSFERAGVDIEVDLEATWSWVPGDPTRLRQVFWNLLSNAIKFTPRGGAITLATSHPDVEQIRLSVADTGAGMDSRSAQTLFSAAHHVATVPGSSSGLGLGLTIVKGIVDAHGGTIRVHSEGPGRGTTFEILLPVSAWADVKRRRSATAPAPVESKHADARILLVEDHQDTSEMLAMLLEMHGYHVVVARSVREARELAVDGCDVLISDIGLPDGSGLDVLRQIAPGGGLPAIALSGFGSADDQRRSYEAGYRIHLTKPVDVTMLLDAIVMATRSAAT
jgi:PAS domain S-box-containing protein